MGFFVFMSNEISDAIVLGVGTPNIIANGSKTMCAILLGEFGLFRIYPIKAEQKFPVWSKVNLSVTKPNTDNRQESWKVEQFEITGSITDPSIKRQILNKCVMSSGKEDPINYQNKSNKSICLIKPKNLGAAIDPREAINDDDWVYTQSKSWAKPFVTWESLQGGNHKSHLVAREAYETIRRNPQSPFDLFRNLNIGSPDWDFWLLMGNMKNRRNVWCCVHVHRLKKTSGLSTDRYCNLINGKPEGWPYLNQETGNVTIADNQLLLFTI